ncbi:MAG: prolipoprotein diacylglyceryl transferase family protein [Anaerolineae bacterium]
MYIGPWRIWPYTWRVGAGLALALLWLWGAAPSYGLERRRLTVTLWLLALGALAGGRLGYTLEHLRYFRARPEEVLAFRQTGGFHGVGVWVGGGLVLAATLGRRSSERKVWKTLSWLTPAALLVAAGAWWGCADAGCAWGREVLTTPDWLRWAIVRLPDLYHTIRPRYPVQMAAALSALLAAGLAALYPRFALLCGAGYMLSVAALGVLRADTAPIIGGVRLDSWLHLWLALTLGAGQARREFVEQSI